MRIPVLLSTAMKQTASAAFSPADIAGLQLWLDASDLSTITESSGKVSQWDDKSGNGNHVTQAGATPQPTTGTRTLNGLNVLDFDGNDCMVRVFPTPIAQPTTIFIVANFDTTSGIQYLYDGGDVAETSLQWQSFNNTFFMFAGGTVAAGAPGANVPFITSNIWNTTSSQLFVNGNLGGSGNAGGRSFPRLRIGSRFTATSFMNGYIAEVIFYNSALSSEDQSSVETFLSDKWGIVLP